MLVVSLTAQAVKDIIWFQADANRSIIVIHTYLIVLNIVLPVALLIINVTVVCEIRRESNYAATNLERHHSSHNSSQNHQQQQSTSSNSAVPTILLVTTSLIYVSLCATWFVLYYVYWWTQHAVLSSATRIVLQEVYLVAEEAHCFVFASAFYVYLIRGKQFRSDLRKLFRRRRSDAAAAVAGSPPRYSDTAV